MFHRFDKGAASCQCAAFMFKPRLNTETGLDFDLGFIWTIQEIFQNYTARGCCCSADKSGVYGMTYFKRICWMKESKQNKF